MNTIRLYDFPIEHLNLIKPFVWGYSEGLPPEGWVYSLNGHILRAWKTKSGDISVRFIE